MFRLSKINFHAQILLTIIVVILFWIPAFVKIPPFVSNEGSIFNFLFEWISKVPLIGVILNLLFAIIASFYLYNILTSSNLQTSSSFVPEMLLLVFLSNISNMQLNAITISGFFLLLAINSLFKINEGKNIDNYIFISSFLIGIATIFNPPIWITVLLPTISILILANISLRKITLSLLGFALIWIWSIAIAFILDDFNSFTQYVIDSILYSTFHLPLPNTWHSWGLLILEIVLIAPLLIILFARSQRDVIINRRRILITIIFFGILFYSCFFTSYNITLQKQLLFIPEVILISYLYEHFRNSKMIYIADFLLFFIFLLNLYERWMILF